jgi:hypothetical protein
LARLRQGANPFSFSVATAGTEETCLHYDVRELFESQRHDLLAIVELYREQKQPSQVFPVLGPAGSGKTHLLTTLQAELRREAEGAGKESLLVVADHFSPNLDPVDFFLWQIVNHLLKPSGPGLRMLEVVSDRLAARLLSEALRRLPPNEHLRLIPPRGFWDKLGWSSAGREERLRAVQEVIAHCDGPSPGGLRGACVMADLDPERALAVIRDHLEGAEAKDAAGTLRRELYIRLAMLPLLADREAIEDYLTADYLQQPAHVAGAGQLPRRLLTAFLELFRALDIPVVLVFDQLEDFLVSPTEAAKNEKRDAFSQALSALINNVPGLCMLVFAERGLWNESILGRVEKYTRDRLDRDFNLPGRPSQRGIEMPGRPSRAALVQLIRRRVRPALGDFDQTGLPDAFPFDVRHLAPLEEEPTIRGCVRKLSQWFNEVVYGAEATVPTAGDGQGRGAPTARPCAADECLRDLLRARWNTARASARADLDAKETRPAQIPAVQTALGVWLTYLRDEGIGGCGSWAKVELLNDTRKGPFGYLNVICVEGADAPGLGLAAWLSERKYRLIELQRRLEFFEASPCAIRTLVLFRRDGLGAVAGATKDAYDEAVRKNWDVRVQPYEDGHLEAMVAFPRWLQAVKPDVEAAGEAGRATMRALVAELSQPLVGWIAQWRQPAGGTPA